MRLTLVSPFDPRPDGLSPSGGHVGGVERAFAELSARLCAKGHEVTLLSTTHAASSDGIEDGVRTIRRRRHLTLFRTPVAHLARHVPADSQLVHVAGTYPFTTPSVLRRAKSMKIPSVLDFHFEPAPGTWLGRFAAQAYRSIGPRAYPLADVVVVRSLAYAAAAPSLSRVLPERLRVVPNGIDVDRFRPEGPRAAGDYLLFVGRLVPYKGLPVLFRALARSPDAPPLHIAGDGPLRPRLERLARSLGADVRFLGRVPDDELPGLYRGARLTVLPSVTAQEAFGIALVESMACGTPVVASDLPGVADVARLGGLVARTRDDASLAAQLERALQPGFLKRGEELSRPIRARFSWDAVADAFLAVYEEIADRGGRAGPSRIDTEVAGPADPLRQPLLRA